MKELKDSLMMQSPMFQLKPAIVDHLQSYLTINQGQGPLARTFKQPPLKSIINSNLLCQMMKIPNSNREEVFPLHPNLSDSNLALLLVARLNLLNFLKEEKEVYHL